jgi:hypothetical protein
MNRIYLDKLFEFTYGTYSNYYSQFNKQIDLNDEINKIKQNTSLNEKGTFIKYSFMELSNLIPSIEYDECMLIYPICFNIEENQEWNNFLNCLLLILNEDYIKEPNITKKKILQIADKMYKKHLKIDKTLNSQNYEKISELTGLNIIILNNENNILKITEYNNTPIDKWIVCYKFGINYFPAWNFDKKYFNSTSYFIKYLREFTKNINKLDEKIDVANKQEDNNVKVTNDNNSESIDKINDAYQELVTNEDYALYISEAVETKNTKNEKNKKKLENKTIGDKKKNKSNKDIFVTLEQNEDYAGIIIDKTEPINENITESVFKKTEIIDKTKVKNIVLNIKSTTKLEQIQAYALELGLLISNGSTKDGKPKNKTKNELIDDIKNLEKTL